jgi:CelD/BcsL family acetyltransferase involved in cellulose biosynthesis
VTSRLEIEVLRDAGPIAAEWDALADQIGAAPWLRPGWIGAWFECFASGSPRVVALRRDGRLSAVLPLQMRRRALASPTNWHTPEFAPVAEDAGIERTLVEALFSGAPRRLALSFLPDRGSTAAEHLEAAAARAGYRVIRRVVLRSPYIEINRAWDELEKERLTSKRRGNLRRMFRGLGGEGRLSLEVADGREGLDELLEEAFRIEALGWKGTEGSAILSSPETRRFYTEVARWAARRGWLRMLFLRLDGRAVAFDFALELGDVHYLVKVGFDPAFGRFAPGVLMRHDMIERAFSLGLRRYEFLGSDDAYKLEWTDRCHERTLVQAFRPSPSGRLDWAAFAYGRPVALRALGRLRS